MSNPLTRWFLAVVTIASTATGSFAGTRSPAPLPTLALEPAPQPSIWSGLYVGSEVSVIAAKGVKGRLGGAVYAGYDRDFANGVVLGVQGKSGYAPNWLGSSRFEGLDYAATDVKIGYDMGRLMPFVTAGVALARPRFGPGQDRLQSDSFNTLMNGPGQIEATGRIGVGAVYALTDNLSIAVAVSTVNGSGLLLP